MVLFLFGDFAMLTSTCEKDDGSRFTTVDLS